MTSLFSTLQSGSRCAKWRHSVKSQKKLFKLNKQWMVNCLMPCGGRLQRTHGNIHLTEPPKKLGVTDVEGCHTGRCDTLWQSPQRCSFTLEDKSMNYGVWIILHGNNIIIIYKIIIKSLLWLYLNSTKKESTITEKIHMHWKNQKCLKRKQETYFFLNETLKKTPKQNKVHSRHSLNR